MAANYELSKTYQYRKVTKPLLERKRRARINKCLDDLKDLIAECLQESDPSAKLEKADILELTVHHLRKVKAQKHQGKPSVHSNTGQSFRSGYVQAVNEVLHCLCTLPNVNVEFGKHLMTQLGLRLRQIEPMETPVENQQPNVPLTINCDNYAARIPLRNYSPLSSVCSSASSSQTESSGYASDCSDQSQRSPSTSFYQQQNLLKIAKVEDSIWRPW